MFSKHALVRAGLAIENWLFCGKNSLRDTFKVSKFFLMFITNRKQMTTMMSEQYFRCVVSAYAKRILTWYQCEKMKKSLSELKRRVKPGTLAGEAFITRVSRSLAKARKGLSVSNLIWIICRAIHLADALFQRPREIFSSNPQTCFLILFQESLTLRLQ